MSISRKMTKTAAAIAGEYPQEPNFRFTLDCLLCAMIAENNRTTPYRAILGKKVKALGVHQTIFDDEMSLEEIANYSKGVGWRDLDAECKRRHIITKNLS